MFYFKDAILLPVFYFYYAISFCNEIHVMILLTRIILGHEYIFWCCKLNFKSLYYKTHDPVILHLSFAMASSMFLTSMHPTGSMCPFLMRVEEAVEYERCFQSCVEYLEGNLETK